MTDALIAVLILGFANGALAQIVTFSTLFEPLRMIATKEAKHSEVADYFEEWITCSLCFGAWSAALISALAVWRMTDAGTLDSVLMWAAGALAIHGVGLLTGHAYRALLALHD